MATTSKGLKKCTSKPPVPVRPKNLVILNSKHLPKPPETLSSESVTNFIKSLNLDIKDDDANHSDGTVNGGGQKSSNVELDDYLEPVSLSSLNCNALVPQPYSKYKSEETARQTSNVRKIESSSNNEREAAEPIDSRSQTFQSQQSRPLPLPPVDDSVTAMPWYKNVDRKKGEELLKNGVDGYFLIRPSSKGDTLLTLTLWFHNRLYNIPIRKRRDGQYALGTPKANEQSFNTIEDMVANYQSEKLVLYSNGAKTGRTLLTSYPP